MKINILTAALAILTSTMLYASEDAKFPYHSANFKNGFSTSTVLVRIYGQPETRLQPGESFSVGAIPTAGGLFNASSTYPFKVVSISRIGCPKELCFLLTDTNTNTDTDTDTDISRPASDNKKESKQKRMTPDFEIFNGSTSDITVQKTGESSWITIPSNGQAKIIGALDTGFTVKGRMEIIQIEKQKCETPYCYRVLK